MSDEVDLNIDDAENADWLHGNPQVIFVISKDGVRIGGADIERRSIFTNDAVLEELFYKLMDEGYDDAPITQYDGGAFKRAIEAAGYAAA